jgi:ubiquinol-cytochrome c reductase cytochrome b subunit/cytochrome b6
LPATLGPRANPLVTPEVIKPEWFFYVMFRWLKLFSGTAAVLSIGFIIFAMFTWPLIDAIFRRFKPLREASVWIGIVAVLLIVGLTVWEAAVEH